jgi:putative endonuclease
VFFNVCQQTFCYNKNVNHKSELGKLGEDKACEYLVNKNFRVIERNFRKPWGELDIIALSPDKTLVFLEVKTMTNPGSTGITPENQITASKIKKFKRTASLYAGDRPELIKDGRGWRLDLIAIVVSGIEPLTKTGEDFVIKHYENIV